MRKTPKQKKNMPISTARVEVSELKSAVPWVATAPTLNAGILGAMMALEVIREIVGFGEGLVGRLVLVDALGMRFETLRYRWDPANPLNGTAATAS